jgi:hypothetical protein
MRSYLCLSLLALFGCAHATEVEPTPPKTHVAFVTRASYPADLRSAAGVDDGLAAADAICTTTAHAAGHSGSFHAWISGSNAHAIDRIVGNGPWNLPGVGRVLDNRDQLATQPRVAFDHDENGDDVFGEVWTGTAVGGHTASMPGLCNDWTSVDDFNEATVGETFREDEGWTAASQAPCSFPQHLLCLEDVLPDPLE